MNLRQLETFLHVAAAGSISRAAAEMRVAQPVVSRTLKMLEDDLGVRLFDRASRGVRLTETGEQLVDRGGKLLREFGSLREEVRAHSTEPAGRLAIGMPPSLSRMLTTRVVPRFMAECPRVLLSIDEANSSALCGSLQSGEIDLAVMSSAEPTHDIWLEIFASEPFTLIGPRDAPYADLTEIGVNDLADLPLILVSRPNALRKLLDRKLSEQHVVPNIVAEANSLIAVAMVLEGIGATILPSSAAWEAERGGQICAVPVKGLRISWAVACQRSNPLSQAGARFLDILRAETAAAIAASDWRAVAV